MAAFKTLNLEVEVQILLGYQNSDFYKLKISLSTREIEG